MAHPPKRERRVRDRCVGSLPQVTHLDAYEAPGLGQLTGHKGFRVCKSEVSGSNEFREGNLDGHRQSLAYRHARLYVQAVFPQSAGHLQHKAQACTVHDSFLQSWQQQRSWRRA